MKLGLARKLSVTLNIVLACLLALVIVVDRPTAGPEAPAPRPPAGIGDVPNGGQPGERPDRQPVVVADGMGATSYVVGGTRNPWGPAQAVAWEWQQIRTNRPAANVYNLCAYQVAVAYGYYGYGFASAKDGGNAVPRGQRHPVRGNGRDIPVGALLYWLGGQYGHVVIYLGDGLFGSNDVLRSGRIDAVSLQWFRDHWGMEFAFWTTPSFPRGFGRNPNPAPVVVQPPVESGAVVPFRPLVAGQRDPRWAKIKAVRHVGNRSDRGGPVVVGRVAVWQARHGYQATGTPGSRAEYRRLIKKAA